MKTLIVILLLISQTSLACVKPVTYLTQSTPAPCTGFLFSPEKEKEVRDYREKFEDIQNILSKQDQLIVTQDQRIDVLLRRNQGQENQIKSLEKQSRFEQIAYFCLGLAVGITATRMITK